MKILTIEEQAKKIVEELSQRGFSASEALKVLSTASVTINKAVAELLCQQKRAPLAEALRRASDYSSETTKSSSV